MLEQSEDKSAIDQSKAKAGRSIVAGNNTEVFAENATVNINNAPARQATKIEQLIRKLKQEIENDVQAKQIIDDLQYYHSRVAEDGIDGLENKLKHSGREFMIAKALMQKEAFAKKMDQYAHFGSAQEIFAFLLSKVDCLFESEITGIITNHSVDDVNKITKEKIIEPIMAELSDDVMGLNYDHIRGMIFWLAEQCFVRWHA